MSILFDRQSRDDRVATDAAPTGAVENTDHAYFGTDEPVAVHAQAAGIESRDLVEQVEYLTDEVEHLRACIDQMLDLLDAQSAAADDVDLLFDWTRLADRRIQRIEDSVGGRSVPRRRAEDAA